LSSCGEHGGTRLSVGLRASAGGRVSGPRRSPQRTLPFAHLASRRETIRFSQFGHLLWTRASSTIPLSTGAAARRVARLGKPQRTVFAIART
jgi:hypothetical protein